nr:hypothetical protein [Streptomyces sp. TLI_235]
MLAARAGLDDWLSEEVFLVVCELLINAYQHTASPLCVDLDVAGGCVTVSVTCPSTVPPALLPFCPERPHSQGSTSWTGWPPDGA